MSKVFDCFMYCDEAEVLEIRLNELDPVVDRFVVCESTRTFSNQPKPLYFLQQQERFARFLPKITHLIVEDFPSHGGSRSDLMRFQRNALARALVDCAPDDIVIISDVDEIPNSSAVQAFQGPISGLRMRLFGCFLNLEDINGSARDNVRSVMCRYEWLGSPHVLRAFGRANNVLNKIVAQGGWHFSHLGDADWLDRKLSSSGLFGDGRPTDVDGMRAMIESRRDSFTREYGWEFVHLDASFPSYVLGNRRQFERLIGHSAPTAAVASFASIYYEQERPEVLDLVPKEARRVLDLGCASGAFGSALKRRQACHVTGVEFETDPAARAATRLDRVVVGDCEGLDLDAHFQANEFDCVIAADVLEHLRDPEKMLRRLQPFLTTDAALVVSIPNVRHAGVLQAAVQGYWSYQKWGILDRTHLRFFTRREIDNMFARLGFKVEERRSVDDPALSEWERLGRPTSPTFGPLTVQGLDECELREFFVIQWLVRARLAIRPGVRMGPEDGRSLIVDAVGLDGLVPHIRTGEEANSRGTYQFGPGQGIGECVQGELELRDQQSPGGGRELRSLRAELSDLREQVITKTRETENLHQELSRRTQAHEQLLAAYQNVIVERDSARRGLDAAPTSNGRRTRRLIRRVSIRRLGPRAAVKRITRGRPRTQRVLRRIERLLRLTLTLQLPGRVIARLGAVRPTQALGTRANARPVHQSLLAGPVFFQLRPLRIDAPWEDRVARQDRGRLICVSHVLPYPPRAGNEYRIDRMLTWLTAEGWEVLLLVNPWSDKPLTAGQLTEVAAHYPNIIVCQPDGTLHYHLRDGGAMLRGLSEIRPRTFAQLLNEHRRNGHLTPELLSLMRTVCPDALVELLLHLESTFDPAVCLAEYVFMSRPFALLRPSTLKIIDTHDVFSSRQSKVVQFGIDDKLLIPPEAEAELLGRADIVIAIQPLEAEVLRALAPQPQIITVGVDFRIAEHARRPPDEPVILLVGSLNPVNVKGAKDFIRFAWPLVRRAVPTAELRVVGSVGEAVDPFLPGIRVLGGVEDLAATYADARVVINPAIAGTGLKIKTVEALCHLRPIVLWPTGVDGLEPELRALCHVATDWFDFARRVIDSLSADDAGEVLVSRAPELAAKFSPETVYAPLAAALNRNGNRSNGVRQARQLGPSLL